MCFISMPLLSIGQHLLHCLRQGFVPILTSYCAPEWPGDLLPKQPALRLLALLDLSASASQFL